VLAMYRPGTGTHLVGAAPIYKPGSEPYFSDWPEERRQQQLQKWQFERYGTMAREACIVKCGMSAVMGFGIGAFFSLMSASFAYEDPYLRAQTGKNNVQKARDIFKDMGKGMVTSGKGFAKVGALFAGIECVIEGYRAKNDIWNSVSSGFVAGGILARNAGPKAAVGGGIAFAAFSAVIDTLFLRRETPEED